MKLIDQLYCGGHPNKSKAIEEEVTKLDTLFDRAIGGTSSIISTHHNKILNAIGQLQVVVDLIHSFNLLLSSKPGKPANAKILEETAAALVAKAEKKDKEFPPYKDLKKIYLIEGHIKKTILQETTANSLILHELSQNKDFLTPHKHKPSHNSHSHQSEYLGNNNLWSSEELKQPADTTIQHTPSQSPAPIGLSPQSPINTMAANNINQIQASPQPGVEKLGSEQLPVITINLPQNADDETLRNENSVALKLKLQQPHEETSKIENQHEVHPSFSLQCQEDRADIFKGQLYKAIANGNRIKEELREELRVEKEKLRVEKERTEDLRADLELLTNNHHLSTPMVDLLKEDGNLRKEIASLQQTLEQVREEASKSEIKHISEKNSLKDEISSLTSQLTTEIEKGNATFTQLQSEKNSLRDEISSLTSQLTTEIEKGNATVTQLQEEKRRGEALSIEVTSLNGQLQNAQQALIPERTKFDQLNLLYSQDLLLFTKFKTSTGRDFQTVINDPLSLSKINVALNMNRK